MSDIAIRVENLSKQYHIGGKQASNRTFREALLDSFSTPFRWLRGERKSVETFWALDDVSFEVKHGEAVGIIGRNGAGKSTLLKILSRITKPTKGRVDLYGRVASLLEVGTGFHSELSGRDNIYLNSAILGMGRREIERKFDEIVEFSGVEKFLDTPVKHYSSGMYVRLAFAVAAHLEPEILIVDEVLAVGDAEFQKKSLGKMDEVARSGRTVLFVSHNMDAVAKFCQKTILLNSGSVELYSDTHSVISSYVSEGHDVIAQRIWNNIKVAPGNNIASLYSISLKNHKGKVTADLFSGENFFVEIDYLNQQPDIKLTATLVIYNQEGSIVFSSISNHDPNWHDKPRPKSLYRSICQIPANLLSPGIYEITLIICANNYKDCFQEDKIIRFNVVDSGEVRGDYFGGYSGAIRPLLAWTTTKIDYTVINDEDT
jgi:lipopolysaccharide transport system ATP-binding protein